ncbi:hypothetical protein [Corallococcus sp. EGB]|uniref:hypothetical protein n=1 Tax=Corallococcus sp. EGB TaxID=1521117 RepID=UPI001CC16C8E|nr:hypothetical protein [Corallococcus sp. EGB]
MKNAKTVLGLVGLAVLLPPVIADACGPDLGPEPRFHVIDHPDRPFETYAAGGLGVLRRTFDGRYLAFAYRSMMGIPTTAGEQKHLVAGWVDVESRYGPDPSWAREQWTAVRQEVAPFKDLPQVDPLQVAEASNDAYIHGDAFLHAAATARALAKEWKQRPALLKEWVVHQDSVFSKACTLADPEPGLEESLTPREQARRKAERDYQAAAMHLYCGRFDSAAEAFQAIANTADSPHRTLAAYLVARTRVREAMSAQEDGDLAEREHDEASLARFTRAEAAIQAVLADPKLREVHGPAQRLRVLVRWRLSPGALRCELFSRVLEKGTGSALESELANISTGPDDNALSCPGLKPQAAELFAWLQLMAAPVPEESDAPEAPWPAKTHVTAVARWKKSGHQPWLVLALLSARADSPEVLALLADAAAVPLESPAGMTLAWRSVQLLRERGQLAEARARLDAIPLERVRDLPSTDNALREERLHLANTWDEALRNAAQFRVDEFVAVPHQDWNAPTQETAPMGLSTARASFLETHVPTRRLREWAALPSVSPELRRQLSWAVLARAAVVGDDAVLKAQAATLAESEPTARAELLALAGRPSAEERLFDARLLIMGLPVVSARLEPGRDRLADVSPKLDLTQDMSWYRNGWCVPGPKNLGEAPLKTPLPFASPEERADAAAEWKALNEAGNSVAFFSRVALDWAKAHPDDPRSPIALYRAVRSSKRGCGQNTPEAKKAFAFLHKQYGKTEWARKTPYVY